MNPSCKNCGTRMLRWAWYEHPTEPIKYWYCLECDKAGREPCIQIHPSDQNEEQGGESMAFDDAVKFVLSHEGGYVCDPHDSGGETCFGISKRAYPELDIKHLTLPQAKDIYRKDYWEKLGLGLFPDRLALVLFDTSVNAGRSQAVKILQRSLNLSAFPRLIEDGILGSKTLTAAMQQCDLMNGEKTLVRDYLLQRLSLYRTLLERYHNKARFFSGWVNRTLDLYHTIAG